MKTVKLIKMIKINVVEEANFNNNQNVVEEANFNNRFCLIKRFHS